MVQQHSTVSQNDSSSIVDNAVAEGGAYEIIRKRLLDQGQTLTANVRQLNEARLAEFGSSAMNVIARVRVRTENNCIPRDIVQVGEYLLFGYNVFIGLKKETKIDDVFSLFVRKNSESGIELEPISLAGTFLTEQSFINDFDELYRYYKNTRIVALTVNNGKLLAGFQIGERLDDIRVFRWSVSPDGKTVTYIDNRGERDIQLPPAFDFEWVAVTREDSVHGRHPHLNILDKIFVEAVNGDLTIKIENNTEDGQGIYSEEVEDKTQSLDDASIFYASVGSLILLRIRPYREEQWRHLIFNTLTQQVLRIDQIGQSCVQLPENHGIIFPGGYYLNTGEHKIFEENSDSFRFKRMIRSPNGEDVLFVFYEPAAGMVSLLAYNLIEKKLQNPIYGSGYAMADNGDIVIFSAESEPTRVHPMQIWETPYVSAEFASKAPPRQNFYGRIGNNELVRGISDFYSITRIISNQSVSVRLYEELSLSAKKIFDSYYWLSESETSAIADVLKEISTTAELVIDEFEKVESIRQQSAKAMQEAETEQQAILQSLRPENWETAEEYVDALTRLRKQRGQLATIKEFRYIDQARIAVLDQQLLDANGTLSEQTLAFLSTDKSLAPYHSKLDELNQQVDKAETNAAITPIIETIEKTASGLDLLSELMGTLKVDDATLRTRIVDSISEVYAKLNQSRANAKHKQKNFGSAEAVAQFGAQFKLFSQSIAHALGLATTPEKCDEQLSKSLVRLEELEGQFSEFDQFLADIMAKREEVYESFQEHKQRLLDDRQKKAQSIIDAAARILASIEKRSLSITVLEELNTYFASDALVLKVGDLTNQLKALDNAIKADDIDARFKAIKGQALRALRDKSDIFEEGGNVIKLGPRHKFSVNTQELDLTIIPRENVLNFHLTGTDYYAPVEHAELLALREYWAISLESETAQVYRAEYLAALIIDAAENQVQGLTHDLLHEALVDDEKLAKIVRDFSAARYKEGYQKGIHDQDAVLILKALVPAMDRADLLRFDPLARGLAQVFWANLEGFASKSKSQDTALSYETWKDRAASAKHMQRLFASRDALQMLIDEVVTTLNDFIAQNPLPVKSLDIQRAAEYLVEELARERTEFITSKYAVELVDTLKKSLDEKTWKHYQNVSEKMVGWPADRWNFATAWLQALLKNSTNDATYVKKLQHYIPEAVALLKSDQRLDRRFTEVELELQVTHLLGEHPLIVDRTLAFSVDSFVQRLANHRQVVVPEYQRFLTVRQHIIEQERKALRVHEFKAKPLSSFVRNRLINESYLPIIGDNLAKQMGALGANKRTDLMGMLMMISPPGYGKTTLMEYAANRLGLIFMKINCPSLGHDVLSLDPEQAPNATARQELVKLNLALEMGNNVMLYLDDIQHTHAEFLQKFISLCDGTRRIEGVWKGQTKTYDMRGKKFCVCMAGNPYTESGEAFKVPDMLANRADIYNLGDILGGMEEQFALSYIENSLTSNSVLAPLALRDMQDVYKFVAMAKGEEVATTDLSHQYSGAEVNEIVGVLKKLFAIQQVVLKINQQYIASAAQDDKYRVEPSFKLQGSYRNMNKMAEKISAVMNDAELMQMIADHYLGEAQMLTTGAESNLLKLAELRGNMTDEQQDRWAQIKKDFLRNKALGGDSADTGAKVVVQLADMAEGINKLAIAANSQPVVDGAAGNRELIEAIAESSAKLERSLAPVAPNVEVINQPLPGLDKVLKVLADTLEGSLVPLVRNMDKKLDIDLRNHEKIEQVSHQLKVLQGELLAKKKPKASPAEPEANS
ncbi:MAG: DNA repair ATPase [Cellvibrio sp.]|uniref:DNA repair ATPase n=1 Tax=Cellvibrio sp. TaxID=1965322 RepID=UPI0031A6DCFC